MRFMDDGNKMANEILKLVINQIPRGPVKP